MKSQPEDVEAFARRTTELVVAMTNAAAAAT